MTSLTKLYYSTPILRDGTPVPIPVDLLDPDLGFESGNYNILKSNITFSSVDKESSDY